jgi:hypothetical protein
MEYRARTPANLIGNIGAMLGTQFYFCFNFLMHETHCKYVFHPVVVILFLVAPAKG